MHKKFCPTEWQLPGTLKALYTISFCLVSTRVIYFILWKLKRFLSNGRSNSEVGGEVVDAKPMN